MEILDVCKIKDGQYFEDYDKALVYCENKMGEELDGLLKTCPNLGIRAKMDIMRAIIAKPEEFKLLSSWVFEYHKVRETVNPLK